jgi:predicted enzyme related to lactoylglutathione lyase
MSEVNLSEIGQIAIPVHDVPKAVAFYRDQLGMKLLFEAPPKLAFFQNGSVRLMLSVPEAPEFDHRSSIIYYKVDDIQGSFETLKSRGVTFTDEPHMIAKMPDYELWMAFFKDADDNVLAIMCEVRD